MSVQYFKRERGGATVAGREVPFIYRDPPKGYFTKKHEPVNIGDIMYMLQPDGPYGDPTRTNEAIQVYARGQNPMVEVSYTNSGGGSTNTSLGNTQASNPYKVEVVRPPLMPLETLQSISNPRMHQNYAVQTNASIFPTSIAGEYDKGKVRLMTSVYTTPAHHIRTNLISEFKVEQPRSEMFSKQLSDLLNVETVPTLSYNIGSVRDNSTSVVTQVKDILQVASVAPMSFTNITVFDPKTNTNIQIEANVKQKHSIAVSAAVNAPLTFNTNDGQIIQLKDYDYKVVNSAYGNTSLTIYVRQDDIKLDRSSPLYAANATVSLSNVGYGPQRALADKISLASILPLISASSSVTLKNYDERALRDTYDHTKINLSTPTPATSAQSSLGLSNQGYNEDEFRNIRVKPLDRVANYGDWGSRSGGAQPPLNFGR